MYVAVIGVVCIPLCPLAAGMDGILLVGRDTTVEGTGSRLLIPSPYIGPGEVRLNEVTVCGAHDVTFVGTTVCWLLEVITWVSVPSVLVDVGGAVVPLRDGIPTPAADDLDVHSKSVGLVTCSW